VTKAIKFLLRRVHDLQRARINNRIEELPAATEEDIEKAGFVDIPRSIGDVELDASPQDQIQRAPAKHEDTTTREAFESMVEAYERMMDKHEKLEQPPLVDEEAALGDHRPLLRRLLGHVTSARHR